MLKSISKKANERLEPYLRPIALIGLVLVAVHFIFILAYSLPARFVPAKAKHFSESYVRPAFHQHWNLFAPEVDRYKLQFEIRYWKGGWSAWEFPVNVEGVDHHLIPKMVRAVGHELNGEANSASMGVYYIDSIAQFDRIEQSYFYYQALRYGKRYFEWNGVEGMDSLQMKLHYYISPNPHPSDFIQRQDSLIFRPVSVHDVY